MYLSGPCTLYAIWYVEENVEFIFVENTDGGLTLIEYVGYGDYVSVPAYYDGMPVTRIGSYAFANNMNVSITPG